MSIEDDILKHSHRVEQRANQLAADMVAVLEDARASILGKLARLEDKMLKGEFETESATRRAALLKAQEQEISGLLAELYAEMGQKLQEAGEDVIQATGAATTASLNSALGLSVSFTKLPRKIVDAWFEMSTVDGLLINEWLSKLEKATRDRIISAGRQSMVEGLGTRAAARLMRQKGVEGSVPGLEGLARTWLASASHHAREETVNAQFGDFIIGWKYTGVLDGRTCLICGPDDGTVFKKDAPKPVLPRHWRCRCTYIPLPPTWRDLGIDADEYDGGTRPAVKHSGRIVNHRDGSRSTKFTVEDVDHVPAKTTYNEWMQRQLKEDPACVRSVLGKTRFELFESGKITLNRMSSQGRIKRLSEI